MTKCTDVIMLYKQLEKICATYYNVIVMCKYIVPWLKEDFGDKITTPVDLFAFYFVLTKLASQVEFHNYIITLTCSLVEYGNTHHYRKYSTPQ